MKNQKILLFLVLLFGIHAFVRAQPANDPSLLTLERDD